jgi:hypothetical protein
LLFFCLHYNFADKSKKFALVDINNPDNLVVKSGHTDSVDLHLTGLKSEKFLSPGDVQTENVLKTYGCEEDRSVAYRHESGFNAMPQTSDYIVRVSNKMRPKINSAIDG